MSAKEKDTYFVAVKAFLEQKGKVLITKDKFGDWDIPGGRIRKDEFRTPLKKVIARKLREELGSRVRYRLNQPILFMRHERREVGLRKKVRIFAVGYGATFLGGDISLSNMHTKYLWVPINSYNPRIHFKGGWLKGMQEYKQLKKKSHA